MCIRDSWIYVHHIQLLFFLFVFFNWTCCLLQNASSSKKYRLESHNLENALFIIRFSNVLDVVISQNFILVIDQFFMFITFLLFLDHYFLKAENKYTSGSEMETTRKRSTDCICVLCSHNFQKTNTHIFQAGSGGRFTGIGSAFDYYTSSPKTITTQY